MKKTLARKPHDFEKLRSPRNAASDQYGDGRVDYLALETQVCFVYVRHRSGFI